MFSAGNARNCVTECRTKRNGTMGERENEFGKQSVSRTVLFSGLLLLQAIMCAGFSWRRSCRQRNGQSSHAPVSIFMASRCRLSSRRGRGELVLPCPGFFRGVNNTDLAFWAATKNGRHVFPTARRRSLADGVRHLFLIPPLPFEEN